MGSFYYLYVLEVSFNLINIKLQNFIICNSVNHCVGRVVYRFRAGMKDLEVMMINTISSAFETISTVEQGVELLDIFKHLQVREV